MAKIKRFDRPTKVENGVAELQGLAIDNTEEEEEEIQDQFDQVDPDETISSLEEILEDAVVAEPELQEEVPTEEAPVNEAPEVVAPVKEEPTPTVEENVSTSTTLDRKQINDLLKNTDLGIFDRLDKLVKFLPQPGNKVVASMASILKLRAKNASEASMNREQITFAREFKKLLTLPQNEFNQLMVYVDWSYKELLNIDNLHKEGVVTINNTSPLDPCLSFIYCANKDNQEIFTFVYLLTILDAKSGNDEISKKPVSLAKATVKTILDDSEIEKLNKFYSK